MHWVEWVFSGVGVAIVAGALGLIFRGGRGRRKNSDAARSNGSVNAESKTIGDRSVGIQANGNVTVQVGLTVREVRELTRELLDSNFPKLRDDAMAAARENVSEFLRLFEPALARRLPSINQERLRDPDIQFTLNDAVMASARRGRDANADLLIELVLARMNDPGPQASLMSLACAEAVRVVPRLLREHIDYLALVGLFHWGPVGHLTHDIRELDGIARPYLPLVENINIESGWHEAYLQSLGCLTHPPGPSRNVGRSLLQSYPGLQIHSPDELMRCIRNQTEAFREVLDAYVALQMDDVELTLTGDVIAHARLDQVAPGSLDFLDFCLGAVP